MNNTKEPKNIYKEIKHKMVDLDMNMIEFAEYCGVNRSHFVSCMNKKRRFGYKLYVKIAKIIPELTFEDFEYANKNIEKCL